MKTRGSQNFASGLYLLVWWQSRVGRGAWVDTEPRVRRSSGRAQHRELCQCDVFEVERCSLNSQGLSNGSRLGSDIPAMGFQLENLPFLTQLVPNKCRVCSAGVRQPGIPGPQPRQLPLGVLGSLCSSALKRALRLRREHGLASGWHQRLLESIPWEEGG